MLSKSELTVFEELNAIIEAAQCLYRWGVIGDGKYNHAHHHLAILLGYRDGYDMSDRITDDELRTLKLLAGPDGYCLYKLMLIKGEVSS